MRKKTKFFTLLLLLPSLLVACNDSTSGTISTDSTFSNSSSFNSSSNSELSSSTSTSSSSSSEDEKEITEANSPWSEEITKLMMEHLGGSIVPFIELGQTASIEGKYVEDDKDENYLPYVLLTGEKFLESKVTKTITTYKEYKWEVVTDNSGNLYASKASKNLSLEVSTNESGLMIAKIFYQPNFDPSTLTDWTAVTKAQLKEYFGNFGLPFVYLGNDTYKTSYQDDTFTVIGGIYNDLVNEEFSKVYSSTAGWETKLGEEDNSIVSTKVDSKGNKMTVTLDKYNNRARLTAKFDEVFDSSLQDSWSTAVVNQMSISLGSIKIPYFYIGTTYPLIDTSKTDPKTITLNGKYWDDSIISDAKAKLTGWSIVSQTDTKVVFNYSKDGDVFILTIERVENTDDDLYHPVLTISRNEAYNDAVSTSYPSEVLNTFKSTFKEEMNQFIPYLYLGAKSPMVEKDSKYSNHITLTGGLYDARILTNFKEKFKDWVIVDKQVSSRYGDDDLDYETGVVLCAAIKKFDKGTYKVGLFVKGDESSKITYLDITRTDNVDKNTPWSDSAKSIFKEYLKVDSSEIPVIETMSSGEPITFEDGQVDISFVSTNYLNYLIINLYNVLKTNGFDVSLGFSGSYYYEEVFINSIVGNKKLDDGRTLQINVSVSSSSYYRYTMSGVINVLEDYNLATAPSAWPKEVSDAVKKKFNNYELPYFYLGTSNPVVIDDDEFKIIGNAYSDSFYTDIREQLNKNGFTIDEVNSLYYGLVGYTVLESGDTIYLSFSTENDKPYVEISYQKALAPKDYSYSAELKTALTKVGDSSFPNVYLGTQTPTFTTTDDSLSIVGDSYSDDLLNYALSVFKENGNSYNAKVVGVGYWYKDYYLVGSKVLDDNSSIKFKIYENDDSKMQLDIIHDKYLQTTQSSATNWDTLESDLSSKISQYFGNNFSIDSFLATDKTNTKFNIETSSSSSGNKVFTIKDSTAYFTNADVLKTRELLEKQGYEVSYSAFDSSCEPISSLLASKTDSKGTTKISVNALANNEDNKNGFSVSIMRTLSYDSNTLTNYNQATLDALTKAFGSDFKLPYVNFGDANPKVDVADKNVSLVFYNYKESIFADTSKAFEADSWDTFENYEKDRNGNLIHSLLISKTVNGKTYLVTITYENTATSMKTTVKISLVNL